MGDHQDDDRSRSGNREIILDAAWQTLAEQDYEAATVRSVARRAQVDPRLVRYYFPSKLDMMTRALTRMAARLEPVDGRPLDRWMVDTWNSEPTAWRALVAAAMSSEARIHGHAAGILRALGVTTGPPGGGELEGLLDFTRLLGVWLTFRVGPRPDLPSNTEQLVLRLGPPGRRHEG